MASPFISPEHDTARGRVAGGLHGTARHGTHGWAEVSPPAHSDPTDRRVPRFELCRAAHLTRRYLKKYGIAAFHPMPSILWSVSRSMYWPGSLRITPKAWILNLAHRHAYQVSPLNLPAHHPWDRS